MVRSETLLTAIVTLSLGRPHFSCKEARPEGLAGTESPDSYVSVPTHAQECISTGEGKKNGREKKGDSKNREKRVREGKKKEI